MQKSLGDLRTTVGWMAQADPDMIKLRARRFANLFADVLQGALLLDEAIWELETCGLARKAIVATLFVRDRLASDIVRTITRDDRIVLDLYHALTRYKDIKPAEAAKHLVATSPQDRGRGNQQQEERQTAERQRRDTTPA